MKLARRLIAGVIGTALAGFLTGCVSTPPSVMDRVGHSKVFAMIGDQHTTDGYLIRVLEKTDSVIIENGTGGVLDGIFQTLAYLDEHPEKTVIVNGPCASACTLLLTKPQNVVFTENARFRFHSAFYRRVENGKRVIRLAPDSNDRMLAAFDDGVRDFIINTNAFASVRLTEMDNAIARNLHPEMFVESKRLPKMLDGGSLTIDDSDQYE